MHAATLPLLGALLSFHLAAPTLALAAMPANLDPLHARMLKAIGVPVVLPAVVPPGIKLIHLVTRAHADTTHGDATYAAIYEGGGLGFAIESSAGGIGDFQGNPVAWFSAEALKAKKVALFFQKAGNSPTSTWISDWVEYRGHFYRLVGAGYARQHLDDMMLAEREVDATWAKRIVSSLRPIKL